MLHQRGREAEKLILEGALPHEVDKVLTDFGFPMGPFAMGDLAGLDVGWRIRKGKGAEVGGGGSPAREMGRFGQKTGAGYYRYEKGDRTPIPDPDVEKIIVEVASEMGITRRKIGDDEILARLLYPMVNEGAKILEEKIAIRASDIDVIWVYGYGWPVYRGGPMFWADQVGLRTIRDRMQEWRKTQGEDWKPAPLLDRLAAEGKTFTRGLRTMRALVTGAASGIGRATCLRLARDAQSRGRPRADRGGGPGPSTALDALVKELGTLGAAALPLHGDMATADAPARVVGEAVARFGGLDGIVSNAGVNRPGPLVDYAVADWDRDVRGQHARDVAARQGGPRRARRLARAPSSRWRRCPAATPTPTSAPTGRARPRSSCWSRCWRRSSAATASASTRPLARHGAHRA